MLFSSKVPYDATISGSLEWVEMSDMVSKFCWKLDIRYAIKYAASLLRSQNFLLFNSFQEKAPWIEEAKNMKAEGKSIFSLRKEYLYKDRWFAQVQYSCAVWSVGWYNLVRNSVTFGIWIPVVSVGILYGGCFIYLCMTFEFVIIIHLHLIPRV